MCLYLKVILYDKSWIHERAIMKTLTCHKLRFTPQRVAREGKVALSENREAHLAHLIKPETTYIKMMYC